MWGGVCGGLRLEGAPGTRCCWICSSRTRCRTGSRRCAGTGCGMSSRADRRSEDRDAQGRTGQPAGRMGSTRRRHSEHWSRTPALARPCVAGALHMAARREAVRRCHRSCRCLTRCGSRLRSLSRVNQGETSAAIKVRLDRGKLAGGMMALRESERKGDEEGEMGCRRCGQSLPRWCGVPRQGGPRWGPQWNPRRRSARNDDGFAPIGIRPRSLSRRTFSERHGGKTQSCSVANEPFGGRLLPSW